MLLFAFVVVSFSICVKRDDGNNASIMLWAVLDKVPKVAFANRWSQSVLSFKS